MPARVPPEDFHPGSSTCPFCGAQLEDPMGAFFDHLDDSPTCRAQYEPWRESVQREAGGS